MTTISCSSSGRRNNSDISTATRVHITQGHIKPDPIAFVNLYGESSLAKDIGSKFIEVIRQDLCNCGAFTAANPSSFIQDAKTLAISEPRLQDWQLIKARFLVCGDAQQHGKSVKLNIKVYDINRKFKIIAFSVTVYTETWRRAAHMSADQIYKRLTGENGMFDSHIAYVEALPPLTKKKERMSHLRVLKIMDQDGANDRALTNGDNLVMSPRFSPDGKTIAFLAFKNEKHGKHQHSTAHVYLIDTVTKRQRALLTQEHLDAISRANGGASVSMTYAPRFSPDGQSVCFSLISNGKSAVYVMNIFDGKIRRLTNHIAIDTSPAYSPDGRSIVFTSDRSGKEKIYIMNADGSNVRLVTHGDGKYSQPVFSPRGDFIAFTKQIGNQFFIGVVRPNGQEERLIVQGHLAEDPNWSPNGRYILFIWQDHPKNKQCVCKVDLTGFFMQKTNTKYEARDCAWSSLLQ
ncbi:MAG: Tol-Pal system protein TolB [Holosporales bacterium]|jgi:TolB protein|nr:Tol-Pal system protein TolB [Holosporales bacterium]